MRRETLTIDGDTPGAAWTIPLLRFGPDARSHNAGAYIQGGLHANEVPGIATAHVLAGLLTDAEREGRVVEPVTLVPAANPVGGSQALFHETYGRFDLGSRINFNRDVPRTAEDGWSLHDANAAQRMKGALVALAHRHAIVLDLHCDEESLPYFYVNEAFWPGLSDLAAALAVDAVLVWSGASGDAFEEASMGPEATDPQRISTTVELRGLRDVSLEQAQQDAQGIMRFLAGRGVLEPGEDQLPMWSGRVTPIDHVEMIRTPAGGPILYAVAPGDHVAEGDLIATILAEPGNPDASVLLTAPQAGLILTRRTRRLARRGDDLVKLLSDRPSMTAVSGALEP
ncbi:MAG: succinylglutamate desuccinylase/aspartoacylase family protein [Pseudomonadota bacterium]